MFATLLSRAFGPWVREVDRKSLRADAIAGVLGALLVLPQGIAFASLAGLPPEYGLYTAIVPCVVAALFGSSRHVVSGPTNANSLALFATLAPLAAVGSPDYIQLALAVTVMVGLMQWLIGVLRLGSIANFISPSALRGFMTGAALLIVVHALTDLLGLPTPQQHGTAALLSHVAGNLGGVQLSAVIVGAATLAAVLLLKRLWPRWPFMLLGLALGTALALVFNRYGAGWRWGAVAVIGPIPPIVPRFHWPGVALTSLPELLSIAFALTIVALGQTISIAKAVAVRSGQVLDTNREFRGQGLSNLIGGFFSSYVSCGSLNRSMPNLQAGARTPLAGVFASFWLLLLIAFTSSLLALIAMPAIAALLMVVAVSLLDIGGWRRLWRVSRRDFAIALATALATLTIKIEMAILLGTILSLVSYLHRTSKPFIRVMGFDSAAPGRPFVVMADVPAPLQECPQLKMIRMEGEIYFGAVPHVSEHLEQLHRGADAQRKHLLVMAKSMNFIDVPAAEMWQAEMLRRRAVGGDLYFHRPRPPVMALWQRTGYTRELGADHIYASKRVAIASIFDRLDRGICSTCTVRVFEECKTLPEPLTDRAPSDRAPLDSTALDSTALDSPPAQSSSTTRLRPPFLAA